MRWLVLVLPLAWSFGAWAGEPRLVEDARIVWRDSDARLGGLSGFEVTEDGARLVAVGDRGIWVTAKLDRDAGRLRGVRRTGIGPLLAISGKTLKDRQSDAEGLALDAKGRAYVSFEGFHRIRRYDPIDGRPTSVPDYAEFDKLGSNEGLEAIAVDERGVLYAIPERTTHTGREIPVFRLRDGVWDNELRITRGEPFREVGADFGPDGKLYVLERKFEWLAGFATRLRRFSLGPDGLGDEETLLKTRFGELDNMEGISVWRDTAGQTRVTMISDDNFFPLQRTLIVEYIIEEG